jgi:putative sterol carrier protein
MSDAITEFFDDLGKRGHQPLLEDVTGTLRLDLDHGRETDHWFIAIHEGDVSVSHRNAKADCVFRTERELFRDIAGGRTNAMAAMLRGAVAAQGNLELLVKFQRLFPGPPRARDQASAAGQEGRS